MPPAIIGLHIRCAEHHAAEIPQYTKYSGISATLFGTKSLAHIIKKEFLEVAYDFGDGWEHIIRLKRVIEDSTQPYPRCIQAVGDAPMENSGGPDGFAEIRMILQDPAHPLNKEIADWIRGTWWHPLDVSKISFRMKNTWRRCIPVY